MGIRHLRGSHGKKAGLPPGSPVHTGARLRETTSLSLMVYDEHKLREQDTAKLSQCLALRDGPGVGWLNVDSVHDVALLQELGQGFGLHALTLEDILNTSQRPKLEDYGQYLYVVLDMLSMQGDTLASEQVSLILSKSYVLSFQEAGKPGDVFDPVRSRIRSRAGRMRREGADFLAYSLLDAVVDNYFVVLERIGERIEDLEEALMDHPAPSELGTLHRLRSQVLLLRRSVWPLREVVSALERSETDLIRPGTDVYLRDLYDHIVHIIDTVETLRDMLSGMLDLYLSSVSYRMNEVMKILTMIATVFIPLTFIVGVYGMNFRYMPELGWHWAYPVLWVAMLGIAVLMVVFFRRKHWL